MSFNTGNDLPSLDERDLYDNATNLDKAMNSTDPTWTDRFGVEKPTIDAALKSAGFMPAGFDFVTGGTLQPGDRNKAVYNPAPNGDNNWYRWNGTFPKEIAANSQPNPKDENNWVPALIKDNGLGNHVYPSCAEFKNKLSDGNGNFTIEVWGDSTSWGSVSNNAAVQEVQNPVTVLDQTLYALYKPNNPVVINKSIPGTNLNSMINGLHLYSKNFDQEMALSQSSIIYCNHAQNDCNSFAHTVDEFRENLIKFVSICRKYNKVPVLVTPNTTYVSGGITEKSNKRLPAFVDAIRDVASTMSVDLVDNYYFYQKTERSVKSSVLVPDGVHPSTKAYGMSGRNMAIPLVESAKLTNPYDGHGLSNVTFKDDFTNSRELQNAPVSKYGNILICKADLTYQRINYPIIIDNPTDDTFLGFNVLSWIDGGYVKAIYNNSLDNEAFSGDIDLNNGTSVDYNSIVAPHNCELYAGLHIVGMFTGSNVHNTNKMSFGGVTLIPRKAILQSVPDNTKKDYNNNTRKILIGDRITFSDIVGGEDKYFIQLSEFNANNPPWGVLVKRSQDLIFILHGSETIVKTNIASGFYDFSLILNHDRSVTISANDITITTLKAPSGAPVSIITTYRRQQQNNYTVTR